MNEARANRILAALKEQGVDQMLITESERQYDILYFKHSFFTLSFRFISPSA